MHLRRIPLEFLRLSALLLGSFALAVSAACSPAGDDDGSWDEEDGEEDPPADDDDDDGSWDDDDDDGSWYDDDGEESDDDDDTGWNDDDASSAPGDDDDDDSTEPYETCDDAFEAPRTEFLSADDSNSQANWAWVREMLLLYPDSDPPSVARPWEFLNYAEFDYEPAEPGHVRIEPQMVETPGEPGSYEMLIAVVAPELQPEDRALLNLVLSVDSSCSMSGNPWLVTQAVLESIAGSLVEGDLVSLVSWSDNNAVLLDGLEVAAPSDPELVEVLTDFSPGGSTNLESGLEAAYELADAHYDMERVNRVVLISDGGANTGVTDEQLIADHAVDGEGEGIYLVGVGIREASQYNDLLMDTVTDLGKGAYLYMDSMAEAEAQFTFEAMARLLGVAARDVQLAVTLPPGFVVDAFSGEDIGDEPSDVEPQHLAPNDQMLYDLDLLDCSPDEDSPGLEFLFTVEWVDPLSGDAMLDSVTMSVEAMQAGPRTQLWKAQALVAYAQAFAEVAARPNDWQRGDYLDTVMEVVDGALGLLPGDEDLEEALFLLGEWRSRYP
jgi:Ca-activated chloride channel family protein